MSTDKMRQHSQPLSPSLSDYYPLSEFNQLSKNNLVKNLNKKNTRNNKAVATVEVYKSIVQELTSKQKPRLNALVKKASGILRLSNSQRRSTTNSSSDDFELDYNEVVYNHILESQDSVVPYKKPDQTVKEFSSHLEENQAEIISKLVKNGGDFSEIWDDYEASSFASNSRASSRHNTISKSSIMSNFSDNNCKRRPEWKYFAKHKLLSTPSNSSVSSSVASARPVSVMGKRPGSFKAESVNQRNKSNRPFTAPSRKENCMRHVVVIRGQVVTFKGDEFRTFSNWFGDEELLKRCKMLSCDFSQELDLSGFLVQEIHMRLQDSNKLVVEAYRPMRNGLPPLRFKTSILLPKGISVDHLIMCRTITGRLVIQNVKLHRQSTFQK